MVLFDILNSHSKVTQFCDEMFQKHQAAPHIFRVFFQHAKGQLGAGKEGFFQENPFLEDIDHFIVQNSSLKEEEKKFHAYLQEKGFDVEELTNGFRCSLMSDSTYNYYVMQALIGQMSVRCWQSYQKIYHIDPDFYADLMKTESIKLDMSLLKKLPFPVFYVDLSNVTLPITNHYVNVQGVVVDATDGDKIYMTVIDKNPEYYQTDVMFIDQNMQRSQIYDQIYKFTNVCLETISDTQKINRNNLIEDLGWGYQVHDTRECTDVFSPVFTEIAYFTIQFLYFLHSKTDDIIKRENRKYRGQKSDKPVESWDVGIRYGEKIRTITKKQNIYQNIVPDMTRNRPRPYVRCAHWHNYWYGSGDDKYLEPKWLEPTYCNGSVSDIIAVIHQVTDKEHMSSGEEMVAEYLKRMGVPFETEVVTPIKGHNRRFDFQANYNNGRYFIEFDGEQHFMEIPEFDKSQSLKQRQLADFSKNEYAKKNRIPLLRIRFDQILQIPEIIDAFFEKPDIHRLNPFLTNKEYYKITE